MPNATERANDTVLPIVIESIGDQGQRVEHGYVWPADSTTVELVNAYSALLTAEQTLEGSRRGIASAAETIREMLNLI